MMTRLTTLSALLLILAVPACAQRGTGAAGTTARGGSVELPSPGVQADQFQSTWGMSGSDLYKFHFGTSLTDTKLPPNEQRSEAARKPHASPEDLVLPPGGAGPVEAAPPQSSGQELEVTQPPAPRRGLFDAPNAIPLPRPEPPPLQGPGALERLGALIRGGSAGTARIGEAALTPAPAPSKNLLENLKSPPAFAPKDVPGFSPEMSVAAGGADYGRRVIGEKAGLPPAVNLPPTGPALQVYPLPVLVEVLLPAAGASAARAADPARALEGQRGIVVDRSFPVLYSSGRKQTAFVRGWVHPDDLMELTLNQQVVRIAVVTGGDMRAMLPALSVPVALHLRMPAAESIDSFLVRSVEGLETRAGFKWRVARGYQLYPSPWGHTVVLTGDLPSSGMDRLLAYPDLARVEPFIAPASAETAAVPVAETAKPAPFRARGMSGHAAKGASDLAVLSTAFPWGGIMMREIFFWLRIGIFRA